MDGNPLSGSVFKNIFDCFGNNTDKKHFSFQDLKKEKVLMEDNKIYFQKLDFLLKSKQKHLIYLVDEFTENSCEEFLKLLKSYICSNIRFAFAGTSYFNNIKGLSDLEKRELSLDIIYKNDDFDKLFGLEFFFFLVFILIKNILEIFLILKNYQKKIKNF
jgi:hypothetical protein